MLRRSCSSLGVRRLPAAAGLRRVAAAPGADVAPEVRWGVDRRAASSGGSAAVGVKARAMEELGGPGLLTTLYWLFVKGYFQTTQQMQIEHSKIYGPLWKSKYGPLVVVNVASAELIEQVLRQEGRHPVRTDMPHWRGYRELRSHSNGPLTEMGPEWQRIRSILNPRMLIPKHVSSYTNTINAVVTDFIDRLSMLRDRGGGGVLVNNLTEELYNFAFEGICSVLFETRMGCINQEVPEETRKFISSVGEMFRLSQLLILFPRPLWPLLPIWRRFVDIWDHLFKVSEELVRRKIEEIQKKVRDKREVEGAYLTHLLLGEKMTLSEVLGSITELLLAGVDTTSNTISWSLYRLSLQPEIQDQLHQEVWSVCGGLKIPSSEDLARMPFLKAVVKETLRLYPVVPGNARVTVDDEIVVGGYLFPKKTLFHLCHYCVSHDESVFPEPGRFLPQRWLRGGRQTEHHPFGSVPFGFGIRACLGRRVAELEMYLLLSRLIQRYEVRPDPAGTRVEPITRTLLCPAQPINLRFLERRAQ